MSNPGNLIRPPVLNVSPGQADNAAPANASATSAGVITRDILSDMIREEVIRQANPPSDFVMATDETIRPEFMRNLADLDTIPDIVKSLRDFSGDPGE